MKFLTSLLYFVCFLVAFNVPAQSKENKIHLHVRNTIIFNQEIDLVSTDTIISAILGKRVLLDPKETLYVVLVSSGGLYVGAQKISQAINAMENVAVLCRYCASGAAYIFCTSGSEKLVNNGSVFITHEMALPKVTARQVIEGTDLLSLTLESLEFDTTMSSAMNVEFEKYQQKIAGKDWQVNGKDNLKYCAKKYVTITCDRYVTELAPNTCANK